jgi:hypothetical protein
MILRPPQTGTLLTKHASHQIQVVQFDALARLLCRGDVRYQTWVFVHEHRRDPTLPSHDSEHHDR